MWLPPLLYWNIKSEMSNLMMSQVHFNSQKTWALSKQQVGVCCRLHASYLANMQKKKKSDSQPVLHLSSFFFFSLTLCKTLRSSGRKVYVQNTVICWVFTVIAEAAAVTWRGNWRRSDKTSNTWFASSRVDENTAGVRLRLQIHSFLRVTVSAVHPIHSPRSLSTSISVYVWSK